MSDSNTIDIAGIDRVRLIVALYRNTWPTGMGRFHNNESFGAAEAKAHLEHAESRDGGSKIFFDYVSGRPFSLTIDGDALKGVRLYDMYAGEGQCAKAVAQARSATEADKAA